MENIIQDLVYDENYIQSIEDDLFPKVLTSWLKQTPDLTTFRINLLKFNKDIAIRHLQSYFINQLPFNNMKRIPDVFEIFPDTIGISVWPDDYQTDLNMNDHKMGVIVDAACGSAVLRGSHVFAPGVLGLSSEATLDDEVMIYADVSGKCKRGLKVEYLDEEKVFVGWGRLRMTRNELFKKNAQLTGIAIEVIMPVSRVPVINAEAFPLGTCLLQNLPSIICTKVLNPQRNEVILDMCAAPGNKTSHIAEMMQNEGIIIAIDRSETKMKNIKIRCDDHSIKCVHSFMYDSTKIYYEDLDSNDFNILDGPPFPPEMFDRVLLDAPCSALGQRPMLKVTNSINALKSHAPLQKKLFRNAVKLLKKSGTLVYSTCTVTQTECESLVVWALKTFPEITLMPAEPLLGNPGFKTYGLTEEQRHMVQRFGPKQYKTNDKTTIYDNTIGFFIARFKKKNESQQN